MNSTKTLPLLVASYLLLSPILLQAQTCTQADFCNCISPTGVISGTITLARNTGTTTIQPGVCGTDPVTELGGIDFVVNTNATLVLDGGLAVTAGTVVGLSGSGNADLRVDGLRFRANGGGSNVDGNFSFVEDAIEQCKLTPSCNTLREALSLALPVNLVSWTATPNAKGSRVSLRWTTSAELDNDYYTLEHGRDGTHFSELTRLSGQAFADGFSSYVYQHDAPRPGTHYYRLSQTDLDGTRTSFDVRTVVIGGGEMTAYPNPATGSVRLVGFAEDLPVQLLDANGRLLADYPAPGDRLQRDIELPTGLSAGIYLLRSGKQVLRLSVR